MGIHLGNQDRDLFLSSKKRERVQARVEKVRVFLDYLAREEKIEREIYGLESQGREIMVEIRKHYEIDAGKVLRSADKHVGPLSQPSGRVTDA